MTTRHDTAHNRGEGEVAPSNSRRGTAAPYARRASRSVISPGLNRPEIAGDLFT